MSQPGPGIPVRRNDPCPCGSGKKYKKCCLGRTGASTAPTPAPADDDARQAELMRDAERHLEEGRHFQAIPVLQEVLGRNPRYRDALVALGVAFGRAGQLESGIRSLRRALAAGDDQARTHATLARQLVTIGRPDEALLSADRAIELDPTDTASRLVRARSLDVLGRLDDSLETVEAILASAPDNADAAVLRARLLRRRGDLDEAQRTLEAIIALDHHPGRLLGHAWHELGQLHDRRGAHADAFEAFRHSGRERERVANEVKIDGAAWSRRIRSYRRSSDSAIFGRWTRESFDDDLPIPGFLVGFPRSGTTLMEQILGAHPGIVTSNERPLLEPLREELKKAYRSKFDIPAALGRLECEQVAAMRTLYWRSAESKLDEQFGDRTLVHKSPIDIIDLALVNVVFPEARVIVAIRDPRDVCLSCFMQMFAPNEATVNFVSWERTAAFYTEVMGLWLHQRPLLRMDVTEIRYEHLVANLETESRAMLDALGVDWNDRVLEYHSVSRRRAVNTPSYTGVSRPVYQSATARWRNYREQIKVVRDTLDPFVKAFGYAGETDRTAVG